MKIEYINGDQNLGIKYDWSRIKKEYKKLRCPKDVYYPLKCDWDQAAYNMCLSDRSRGKTTNPLLVSFIMYRDYLTTPHYLRNDKDQVRPMIIRDMCETIRDFRYIERIFGGEYNDIEYRSRRWTLVKRDEQGDIVAAADRPLLVCFGLNDSDSLKSTYNAPRGDVIILDEFIESVYRYNSFFNFKNIIKTIVRDRLSAVCWMLANTTDIHSPWFDDLMLRDQINTLGMGQAAYIEAGDGVRYYIDIMSPDTSERREKVNMRYFGRNNPKLNSITGRQMWSTKDFPHIPPAKIDEPEEVYSKLYMQHAGRLVRLVLVRRSIGLCVHVVPAVKLYSDSWCLTMSEITTGRQLYGSGPKGSILETYWRLYKANRWYYATNYEGALVEAYIKVLRADRTIRGGL